MAQIFISYSRKDFDFIEQLAVDLKVAGLNVWYDLSGLEGGAHWRREIEKAIKASLYVIVVLSPDSVASIWVEEETLYARNLKRKIIPLLYRSADLPLGFYSLNFIDVQGGKYLQNYKEILRALDIKRSDREFAEKVVREKARLEAEEKEKRRIAEEKAEREAADKTAREKAGEEATEKARLEAEEQARQKAIREKAAREKTLKSILSTSKPILRIIGIIGIVIILFWFGSWGFPKLASLIPTTMASLTATFVSQKTPTPTEFPYSLETLDSKNVVMRLVSAGDFLMGDNKYPDESPLHKVYLKSFYIDKYEVSNFLYKACVEAGECDPPKVLDFYSNTKYETHPVVYVDWDMANAYCEWRGNGTRLPSEEEWEKAARGTTGWTYPWGFKLEGVKANYDNNLGTVAVDVFPNGQSSYQVFNMAGNVREWILDWYDVYPNGDLNASNDFGRKFRVLRGGAWDLDVEYLRTASRDYGSPKFSDNDIGFRCAMDATP